MVFLGTARCFLSGSGAERDGSGPVSCWAVALSGKTTGLDRTAAVRLQSVPMETLSVIPCETGCRVASHRDGGEIMWKESLETGSLFFAWTAMWLGWPGVAGAGPAASGLGGPKPTPRVILVDARVDGMPDAASGLRSGLTGLVGGLEACQRRVQGSQPGSVGRLAMEVTMGPKGRILDVRATRSSTVGRLLLDCSRQFLKHSSVTGWSLSHQVVASVVFDFLIQGRPPKGTVAAGGLTKSLVAGVIQAHLPELAPCVPAGRKMRMILSGVIRFDGRVRRVKATGRRMPRTIRTCVAAKARSWLFPFGKGGHRTWFQFPAQVVGGEYLPPRAPARTGADSRSGEGAVPSGTAGSRRRNRATARSVARSIGGRERARPSPKVGLVEVKVGATFIPGDVDSKVLNRRLSRILKRMKKCGGLAPGVSYKLFLQVDRKGAVTLVPVTGLAVPKVGLRCLKSAVAHVTFPVSATRAHGYRITVSVRGLEGASVKHHGQGRHRHRRRRR